MYNQDYHCTIQAPITPKEALEKIKLVQHWWATNFTGSCQHVGDEFTVRFGKTFGTFKITELLPATRMVWAVTHGYLHLFTDKHEWHGTSIVWQLAATEEGTQITMLHQGLGPQKECFSDCTGGWNFYIQQSLYTLLTSQAGMPGSGIRTRIANGDRQYEGLLYPKDEPLPGFADGYIVIDVKEIKGEDVLSAWNASILDASKFDAWGLRGEHYMLVENKPVVAGIQPLKDIEQTINSTLTN